MSRYAVRRSSLLSTALTLGLLTGGTAHSQPSDSPAVLTPEARKEVVDKTAAMMRDRYVFPDTGEKSAAKIEAQLASGAYDGINDPQAFAKQLTDDLASIAHDKHLSVSPPPRLSDSPAGSNAPPAPPAAEAGIVRADRLAGNIGYIEIIGFPPPDAFKPALNRAMASLADTRALIIDDRRNHGGSPDGVAYLVSFFVPNDQKTALNTFYSRKAGTKDFDTRIVYTSPTPTKYVGKPVYLLSSSESFSGR